MDLSFSSLGLKIFIKDLFGKVADSALNQFDVNRAQTRITKKIPFLFWDHTVWEPLLGEKKCSGMETITGVKFMHFLIEIYQN